MQRELRGRNLGPQRALALWDFFMQNVQIAEYGQRRGSDWIGFVCFSLWTGVNAVMAVGLFRRAPGVALFLVPTFAHEALIAIAFLLRKPLLKQAEGWTPRLAAFGATFIMPVFCIVASRWQHGWMQNSVPPIFVAGTLLWLAGAYLGLWSLFRLRAAFSIVPQARTLVTTGPYRVARHPIYASYLLQYGGVVIAYFTPALMLVYLAWFVVMMLRVSYEESVLASAYPEYAEYRRRVGKFGPHFGWHPRASSAGAPVSLKARATMRRFKA